jgi:hypothetical protein
MPLNWVNSADQLGYPSFECTVADIYNKLDDPNSTQRSENYEFTYEFELLYFIFLTSVFTPMFAG